MKDSTSPFFQLLHSGKKDWKKISEFQHGTLHKMDSSLNIENITDFAFFLFFTRNWYADVMASLLAFVGEWLPTHCKQLFTHYI